MQSTPKRQNYKSFGYFKQLNFLNIQIPSIKLCCDSPICYIHSMQNICDDNKEPSNISKH